jgi:hypothetical protein
MAMVWPTRHAASRVSDAIAPRLARGGHETYAVHGVFRSALNISTPGGLLTLACGAVGGLPNGIVVDGAPDFRSIGAREGMAAHIDARALRVDSAGLAIDLGPAALWSPRLAVPVEPSPTLAARWRRRSNRVRLIAATGGRIGGETLGTASRAAPILARVDEALRDGDPAGASNAARPLIGLGPGLTPSGDDALVGIEAGLWAIRSPMAGFTRDALDDLDGRTTMVAATLLRHAAAGEFAERLHDLVGALLGADEPAIPAALERAIAWGATSGTDCLVGVLLGLDAATRAVRTID